MHCWNCGGEIRAGAHYCSACGQKTRFEASGNDEDGSLEGALQNDSHEATEGPLAVEKGGYGRRAEKGAAESAAEAGVPFDGVQSDKHGKAGKTAAVVALFGIVVVAAIIAVPVVNLIKTASKAPDSTADSLMLEDEEDTENQGNDDEGTVEDSESEGEWYTADEVSEQYQYCFFAKRDDAFYPVDATSYNADGNVEADGKPRLTGEKNDGVLYTGRDDPADFRLKVHVSSGEKLAINFNDDELKLMPVVDMGYYQTLPLDFDEIDGVETDGRDLELAANTLSKEDYKVYQWSVIGSDSKDDFITIGNYYGSDFEEEESYFETPYCIALKDKSYKAPIKKTKLGYFEADLKDVPLGTYIVDQGLICSVLILE